jgi:phospholipid/cholesterol/gamma-HCH transport system ATP-binding protein
MTSVVSVNKLYHSFGDIPVLQGLSFDVKKGEVLGLLGPGGVGKTVVLKLIAGLLDPNSGDIHVFGTRIQDLDSDALVELRARMGMLFQNYALFDSMTIAENAGFPLLKLHEEDLLANPAALHALVTPLLNAVGLVGIEDLHPDELSGGMKKRVGLARATVHEPELLLYDDPTAGLDPVISSKIMLLIRNLHDQRKSTDIIVSHDIDRLVPVCDRYILLENGAVHFEGTLDQAREQQDDPLIKAYFFREMPVDLSMPVSAEDEP